MDLVWATMKAGSQRVSCTVYESDTGDMHIVRVLTKHPVSQSLSGQVCKSPHQGVLGSCPGQCIPSNQPTLIYVWASLSVP